MTTDFFCRYHRSRNAIDKCENCGAYICLDCKKVVHETQSKLGLNSFSNSYPNQNIPGSKLVLCPLCYFNVQKRQGYKTSPVSVAFPIVFIIMFVGVFLVIMISIFSFVGNPSPSPSMFYLFIPITIIIPFFFIFFVLWQTISVRKKISRHSGIEQDTIFQPLDRTRDFNDRFNDRFDDFCPTCGSKLDYKGRYCSNCGALIDK